MTTYEFIKALPGRGTNWGAILKALRAMYAEDGKVFNEARFLCAGETGVRAARSTAMEMAVSIVWARSRRIRFIPPSPETLTWGGFLGGENCVWTDKEAEEAAEVAVCAVIKAAALPHQPAGGAVVAPTTEGLKCAGHG